MARKTTAPAAKEPNLPAAGPEAWSPCPVVGIGASAGGLEAFSTLLGALPGDTGMAYVLVQHLDPAHESALAELLRSHTALPVNQIEDGTLVRPNNVYVIPPNASLSIEGARLHIRPRVKNGERYMPIDSFLSSLARDQKSKSFGVILSGSASDGTLGLLAVKEAGGITFAQDEASAKFPSMPRSAVAMGAVDFVLPPERIAKELATLARHGGQDLALAKLESFPVEEGPEMQRVLALLEASSGVDFTHYKPATVKRRLARRMLLRRAEPLSAYLNYLDRHPAEIESLFEDLLIHVTEFFRDPETFDFLKRVTIPGILKSREASEAVRVWVPACSTGEEVYSLAICMLETMEDLRISIPLQIFGTDVSDAAIVRARAGIYAETVTSVIPPERLRKYFVKVESGYQIQPAVRTCCIFSRHNVIKDPPLSRLDLISCRNLLIYLGPVLQKRALTMFHYALRPLGCLVLGHSEALGNLASLFEHQERGHQVFCRKDSAGTVVEAPNSAPWPRNTFPDWGDPLKPVTERSLAATQREADRFLLACYAPSGFLVDDEFRIVEFRGQIGPFLGDSPGDASFHLLRMIREELALPVRSALDAARKSNATVIKEGVRLRENGSFKKVNLTVAPLTRSPADRHFLILFESPSAPGNTVRKQIPARRRSKADETSVIAQMEEDLVNTRQYLQSIIEELRSANEEVQSSNEELQSTNEELQTAKEELQSTNEELTTINEELQGRNSELALINNDLVNLLSSINMPIVMLGRDLRIRRFTPLAEKAFNLIPADVGRPILDIKPNFEMPDLEELLTGVIRSLTLKEREVQDRQGRWHLMRVWPYRTIDDKIEGAVLQMVDIDELKRSLDDAKAARRYAEAIVNTVREPLVVLDAALCVQRANRSFYQTFGLTVEESESRPFLELSDGVWESPKLRVVLDEVLKKENKPHEVEMEQDLGRAGRRNLVFTGRGIQQENGPALILLAISDITERKQTAEARFRRLFEAAQDGIIIVSTANEEVTDVNPYLLNLFGHAREEWVGKRFSEIDLVRRSGDLSGAVRAIADRGVVRYDDVAVFAKTGRPLRLEVVANVYDEGEKRVIQFNVRDVTERRRMELKLRESAKLESLGLLAGGVAHDFNNLLTGIMGNASLAVNDLPPESTAYRLLEEVVRASERAADLTRQMLAYAGKGRFLVRQVDLSHVVRDIVPLIQTSIPRLVRVELDLPADLPRVEADPAQMQQVLMNLIINAGESIKDGSAGVVSVKTSKIEASEYFLLANFPGQNLSAGPYVCVQVKDTGSGIDESTKAKMFDPFFTTKFTGRGLGLAAVQGIVRGHQGGIRVASVLGQGTTFEVLFPVSQAKAPEVRPVRKRKSLHGKGTVLVVDDEELVRDLAKQTLERYGYQVLVAENGDAGVRVLQENPSIGLVILDMTMPVMGGPETFEAMKQVRPDVPVVLSSGYNETEAIHEFQHDGLAGFIQKPYTAAQLAEKAKASLT